MLLYKWSSSNNMQDILKRLTSSQNSLPDGSHLSVKNFHAFITFFYVEPIQKEVEFNRGTIHYVRHFMFAINYINKQDEKTYIKGIAFFDILERIFLTSLVLIGLTYTSESFIIGLLFSLLIYLLLIFISNERDKKTLHSLKSILGWDDS